MALRLCWLLLAMLKAERGLQQLLAVFLALRRHFQWRLAPRRSSG